MSFLQTLKEKVSSKLSNQEHQSTVQSDSDELSAADADDQQQNDQSADEQPSASVFAIAKDAWNQGANKIKAVISSNDPVEAIEETKETVEETGVTTTEAALDPGTEKAGSLFENMKEALNKGADKFKDTVTRMGSSAVNTDKSDDEIGGSEEKNDEGQGIVSAEEVVSDEAESEKSNDLTAESKVTAVTASVFSSMKSVLSKGVETIKDTASNIDMPDSIADAAKGILSRKDNDDLHNSESEMAIEDRVDDIETAETDTETIAVNTVVTDGMDTVSETTENSLEKTSTEVNVNTVNDEAEKSNHLTMVAAATAAGSVFGLLKSSLSKGVNTLKDTASDIDTTGSVTDIAKNALNKGTDALKGVAANFNASEATEVTEAVSDSLEQTTNISASNEKTDAGQETSKAVDSTETELTPDSIAEVVDIDTGIADSVEDTVRETVDVDEIVADSLEPETMAEGSTADVKKVIDDAGQETSKAMDSTETELTPDSIAEVVDIDTGIADSVEDTVRETVDVDEIVADSLEPETMAEGSTADVKKVINDAGQEAVKAVNSAEIELAPDAITELVETDSIITDDIAYETADAEEVVADSSEPQTMAKTLRADAITAIDDAEQETANAVSSAGIEPVLGSVVDSLDPETVVEPLAAETNIELDDAEQEASEAVTSTEIEPDLECEASEASVDTVREKSPEDESTIVSAVSTLGTAFDSGSKVLVTEAEERPEAVDLNSPAAWAVEDSTVVDSNPFDVDKAEETTIPTFDAYDESNLGAYAEPEKKTRYGWMLPVILLSLFSAAWWLNFAPGRQSSSGDVDFAMLEEAPAEQSEVNSVAMDADYDEPLSKLASVDEDIRLPEAVSAVDVKNGQAKEIVTNLSNGAGEMGAKFEEAPVERPETSSVVLGADYEGPLSKLASVDEGIASPEVLVVDDAFDAQVEIEGSKQSVNDPSSVAGANVVAMIQAPEPVVEQKNDDPVEAVARFLATDNRDSLPKGFVLHGLNFETASSRISKDSARIISDLASTLEVYPTIHIRLEGHTDNRGNVDKNLALSNTRARAVKAALVSLNLDPARISAVGMGDEYPIMDNETEIGQAENRRVEIIITQR